ncbi:methyltransferase [Streptomyces sp. NPDC048606]|uniref:methyltransferase n=1 Tax=Streptomyces sp. NPDC048606 TaxID=3154726 RepID=UPI00341C2281
MTASLSAADRPAPDRSSAPAPAPGEGSERYGERIFGQGGADEHTRLLALADVLDPHSRRALLNPATGTRRPVRQVLELAAGAGTLTRHLLDGLPTAHVTATDLDGRFLSRTRHERLTVLRHDVTRDELPEAHYDLIHARYLLHHLPDRDAVFARIVRWLAPGGRLVIEEPALFSLEAAVDARYRRVSLGALRVLANRLGTDCTHWGPGLPRTAAAHGLTGITLHTAVPTVAHDTPMGRFWSLTVQHLADDIAALPGIAPADAPSVVEALSRPGLVDIGMATVTVTATKPRDDTHAA